MKQSDIKEEAYRLKNIELSTALEEHRTVIEELKDLTDEKDEFMAIAAHDLRSPLGDSRALLQSIIRNYDKLDKNEVLSICEDILTMVLRMSSTVHNFLELSHTGSRSQDLSTQPIEITFLARRATMRHIARASAKGMTIEVSMPNGELWASGDASLVDAIVDNLISNAVKYSPMGSNIQLVIGSEPKNPSICILDEGPGISDAKVHLLFTKYANIGSKPTGGEGSLGLGLYLAQKLAKRMDATIKYKSGPNGNGACFTLELKPSLLLTGNQLPFGSVPNKEGRIPFI